MYLLIWNLIKLQDLLQVKKFDFTKTMHGTIFDVELSLFYDSASKITNQNKKKIEKPKKKKIAFR